MAREIDGEKKKGGSKVLIIVIVLVVVLINAGIGLYVMGVFDGGSDEVTEEELANQEPEKQPPIFYPIEPPLIVNFEDDESVRFLQVTIQVMSRNQDVISSVEAFMPPIRNNLLMLFSGQTYDTLSTAEGKKSLREQALLEIQGILEPEIGTPNVEEIYFTSFVIQ